MKKMNVVAVVVAVVTLLCCASPSYDVLAADSRSAAVSKIIQEEHRDGYDLVVTRKTSVEEVTLAKASKKTYKKVDAGTPQVDVKHVFNIKEGTYIVTRTITKVDRIRKYNKGQRVSIRRYVTTETVETTTIPITDKMQEGIIVAF